MAWYAPVAQLVEQLPLKQTVVGPIPTGCTRKQKRRAPEVRAFLFSCVPGRGLEPPWVAPPAPKAGASTNFATRA